MSRPATPAPVALVTGAGRGLGAAIAIALAEAGHAVAVNYRRDDDAASAVRDQIAARGGDAEIFRADVTDAVAVTSLHQRVTGRLGDIGVLVLNATGPQPDIPIEALTWTDMVEQLRYFALSPLLLTQAVLGAMRRRGAGRIISVGSEVVELGVPGTSAYVAAKAAQLGLTRSWARELAPHGITVNAVAPGLVPTDRHAGVSEAERRAHAATVPLRRLGTPDDVAAAVVYLASTGAAYVTGQRLAVNGGNTLAA
jgi:3-oxoacyl-[acyl-carrier protein] reductase